MGLGHLAQGVQAVGQVFKLGVGQDRAVGKQGDLGMDVDGDADLTHGDHPCPQGIGEIQVILEACQGLRIAERGKVAGIPHVADHQVPQVQGLFQGGDVLGILVAHLGALEPGQCHLADALLIGKFTAQGRQIVIGPVDGGAAKLYVHCFHSFLFSSFLMLTRGVISCL